jgi:hypothetical protein
VSEKEREARRQRLKWAIRFWGPVWVRDLWLLAVTGLVALSLAGQSSELEQQRSGRKVAIQVLCAGEQAVINAGRAALQAQPLPPRLRRNLERLGYPHAAVQRKAAVQASDAYARTISAAVQRQSGAKGLVDAKGNLRCDLLVKAAHAGQ